MSPVQGSEQGVRPVVIIQNDTGNKYPTVIVCDYGRINKAKIPTHVEIEKKIQT